MYTIETTKTSRYCSAFIREGVFIIASVEASTVCGEWWINRALVKRHEDRRQGLGGRLLETLKTAVKAAGGTYLLVTPGGYEMAEPDQVRFYKKHGFDCTDDVEERLQGLLRCEL